MASDLRGGEAWAVLTSTQLRSIPRRSPGLGLTALPPGSSSLSVPRRLCVGGTAAASPRPFPLKNATSDLQKQEVAQKPWPSGGAVARQEDGVASARSSIETIL